MGSEISKLEIWNRLIRGELIRADEVRTIDGRIDLRALHVQEPVVTKKMETTLAQVGTLEGTTDVRRVTLKAVDFSSSTLPGLRFFGCEVVDCLFDSCRCHDWRVWGTRFSSVSFRSANLRDAALGGVQGDNRTSFHNVDFTSADLRGTAYQAAEFVGCKFKDTRLDKVEFEGSNFVDCSFEGDVREVIFSKKGFNLDRFPANEMVNVDFSRARLRWTEFRNLELDRVRFPDDNDHIVVRDWPYVLERLIGFFEKREDDASKAYTGFFEHERKWLGSKQKVGILNKTDLREVGGEEGLKAVSEVIGTAEREPRKRVPPKLVSLLSFWRRR